MVVPVQQAQTQVQTINSIAPWWVAPVAYLYEGLILVVPFLLIYGGWRFLRASHRRHGDDRELATLRDRVQALEQRLIEQASRPPEQTNDEF